MLSSRIEINLEVISCLVFPCKLSDDVIYLENLPLCIMRRGGLSVDLLGLLGLDSIIKH